MVSLPASICKCVWLRSRLDLVLTSVFRRSVWNETMLNTVVNGIRNVLICPLRLHSEVAETTFGDIVLEVLTQNHPDVFKSTTNSCLLTSQLTKMSKKNPTRLEVLKHTNNAHTTWCIYSKNQRSAPQDYKWSHKTICDLLLPGVNKVEKPFEGRLT